MDTIDNSAGKYQLAALSSAAFSEIAARHPVILLPLGSHEDHGPFLPMGDYGLATAFAGRIAAAASTNGTLTYTAPTLPFGVADYFGCVAGGLAISADSFRRVLQDLLAGLLRHGLQRIVILNGHGGNVPVIHEVTLDLRLRHNIIIPSVYLWKIAKGLMQARLGPGHEGRFGHGAEPLLSLSMALRSREVTADQTAPLPGDTTLLGLPVSGFGTLDFEGLPIDAPAEFDQVPREAMAAALKQASPALGAAVASDLIAMGARFVSHFAAHTGL